MTPVDQDNLDDGRGNCFSACLASILELPLSEVPNFASLDMDGHGNMHDLADKWLAERGLAMWRLHFSETNALKRVCILPPAHPAYCVMSGVSPRPKLDGSDKWHAVVGHACGWGVEMAHDPHPSRAGLLERKGRWLYFVVGKTDGRPTGRKSPV